MRPWQAGGLESLGSMASVIQPSFALGELSQDLSGRVDLEWYGKGLELCDNFYVLASGGVTLRPGTEFVCEVPAEAASSTAGGASVASLETDLSGGPAGAVPVAEQREAYGHREQR